MQKRGLAILVVSMCLMYCSVILGKETQILTLKGNGASWQVKLSNEIGMLSRDGSKAVAVRHGTVVTKPGIYYLTKTKDDGTISIEQFCIPYPKEKTQFQLRTLDELEEVIKQILEQKSSQVMLIFPQGQYTSDQVFELIEKQFNTVVSNYPALTYDAYQAEYTEGSRPTVKLKIEYPFKDQGTFKTYDQKAKAMIPELIKTHVKPSMLDYQREWALYQYVIGHITYKDTGLSQGHTMQGALIDGVGVCDGYADLMMYLLNSIGIPTTLVTGKAGEEGSADKVNHAWNQVQIQNQRYYLDVTWGDQDSNQIGNFYDYFNESESYMAKTHVWDKQTTLPATSTLYSSTYMPTPVNGVFKVKDYAQWQKLRKKLGSDGYKEATIIFYDQAAKKWNKSLLVSQIIEAERSGIIYSDLQKYNTLIIQYKLAQ